MGNTSSSEFTSKRNNRNVSVALPVDLPPPYTSRPDGSSSQRPSSRQSILPPLHPAYMSGHGLNLTYNQPEDVGSFLAPYHYSNSALNRSNSWNTRASFPSSIMSTRSERSVSPSNDYDSRQNTREDPFLFLQRFDTVMIIDDSGSMKGALWKEARDALAGIADKAAHYDSNGIDIHFLNSSVVGKNIMSSSEVRHIFKMVVPEGITPTGEKLEELLLMYFKKLEHDIKKPKPVNFVVLTDGAPTDDPESVIVTAARRLDCIHAPLSQVGIQFVQLGAFRNATIALKKMDDDLSSLHNVRDMVDTTLYTGQRVTTDLLGKILLGGVNRRVDKKGFGSLI